MTTERKFEPPAKRGDYPPDCLVCGGSVTERSVTLSLPGPDGETRIVHHVPAGVCESCGEQYLRALVAQRIERLLEDPPADHENFPVWNFVATG